MTERLLAATLSWRGAVGLLVLELAVQLPVTLTSATNAQRSHDIVGEALWLLAQPVAVAGQFYSALRLPYLTDILADQRLGAILGWVLAELPVILAVTALVRRWATQDHAGRDGADGALSAEQPFSMAGPPEG